jgi:endonuclease-8
LHPDARGPVDRDQLLDQRVVAGIGNIWKCESLYAAGIDPRARVRDLAIEQLIAIYRAARVRMQDSVAGCDRYAVYSRTGQPCRTCGTSIETYRLGDPPRWTWSCPRCQRVPLPPGGGTSASGS